MRNLVWYGLLTGCAVTIAACRTSAGAIEDVAPNDNRVAAGALSGGELTLRLEARRARWSPDRDKGPSLVMPMFAEEGRQPQNPGPLVRVPAGTTIRVSIKNTL